MRLRPRLSAVLLTVNLAVIALPFGSIFFFRIYENQLIQETERELISQAALIGAMYRQFMVGSEGTALTAQTRAARSVHQQNRTVSKSYAPEGFSSAIWTVVDPQLDLATVDTLPARPDGRPPTALPSAAAAAAGRAMSPVLDRAQRTSLIGARVLDEHGTTVGGTAEVGLNFAHVEEVAAALAGRYASALRFRELENAPQDILIISRGTGVRVFVAMPVVEAGRVLGVVYLSRTPKSIIRHMYDERYKVGLALGTILFLSISLALLTSRTISRPVAELLARTRRVTRGDAGDLKPLERPGTREMAELSDGISQMARALSDRAAYIRTLASHVSHEFKTPLTSIEGAAELLQDHHDTMTTAERQKFLENISGDGARLRALLDRLLDLARAENTQRGEEVVDLANAVQEAVSGVQGDVATETDVPPDVPVRITEEALTIVLGNLIDNSVKHGANHIRLIASVAEDEVTLTVSDDGRGISPANREKIFEHFFTTRRDTGGTGLGLGICQALMTAHGGNIALAEPEGGHGATFVITLKAHI